MPFIEILRVVRHQVKNLKPHWQSQLNKQKEQQKAEKKKIKSTVKSRGKAKESAKDSENMVERESVEEVLGINVRDTIAVSIALSSTILDMVLDEDESKVTSSDATPCREHGSPPDEDKGQAECKINNHWNSMLTMPSLRFILTQLGWKENDIIDFFPHIDTVTSLDVQQGFVLQRLHRLLAESSTSITSAERKNLLQAILSHYAFWLRDAVLRGNSSLGQYVRDEIERHCHSLLRGIDGGGPCQGLSRFASPMTNATLLHQSGGGNSVGGVMSGHLSPRHDSSVAASAAWSVICYRQICSSRFISQDSQRVLHILVLLMSSQSSPLIRARCMKAISSLVRTDSSLLRLPRMEELVLERFNDVSISVREETVKLVGKYLLSLQSGGVKDEHCGGQPLSSNSREISINGGEDRYLNGLLVRLRDKGVSVRKSVAHTLREILLHQPEHPRYTELCR